MSHLGKTLRIAAKAKAQARVGKAIRARKALLPELHEAQKAMKKVRIREDGGKVDGVKAQVRADKKPRTKKAWGGSLTPDEVDAALAAVQQKPGIASQIAGAYAPAIGSVANAARALTGMGLRRAMREANSEAEPVTASPFRDRPNPWAQSRATDLVQPAPPMPVGSPRTIGFVANQAAAARQMGDDGAAESRGQIVASRPERRTAPDMVVTAPAPVARNSRASAPEALTADRLNAMSLAQSRMGPPSAEEMPRGAAEVAAARNMIARRQLIENNPTVGGQDVAFDPNMKRGGGVKKKSFPKSGKSGNNAGNRAR